MMEFGCLVRVIGGCHNSSCHVRDPKEPLSILRFVFPRCACLSQVNSLLREQLEQAGTVNQGLTESLWKAREDVELTDTRLRREQEVKRNHKNEETDSEK